MEIDVNAEAKDKRLNRWVALTVVALSIIMGLGQVKDGNIVQAMQQAQSDSVDHWNEYQAAKTKLHIDEVALAQSGLLAAVGGAKVAAASAPETQKLRAEIAKYQAEIPKLKTQAEGDAAQYDALNVHDDQFDASDAFLSIAISIAAVAALAEAMWALYAAWGFGALGVLMSAAGFFGWSLHWDFMAKLLS